MYYIIISFLFFFYFFFFQAEDGIRDRNVTGVQTCALPISSRRALRREARDPRRHHRRYHRRRGPHQGGAGGASALRRADHAFRAAAAGRSEERRVGKEWRSRCAPWHEKKKGHRARREARCK